jgi:endonuclease/exonuclease/phosphatase family metal-dependent hydrolase
MEEFENENLFSVILYHPLCDLQESEIKDRIREKILTRRNVKFLTYNIFLRPPPIKNNENDWKDERLEDFCKEIHNFDIICLQEMFGTFSSRKQNLIRHATKTGFFFYIDTSSPSFMSKYLIDGGLVILSRFPIISYLFHPFKYGVISDSIAQKGVLYAKVMIKDVYVHLFVTHLQASYMHSGEYHFQVSCETRLEQVKQTNVIMSKILSQEYSQNDTILLAGDFNVDALKYQYKKPVCIIK